MSARRSHDTRSQAVKSLPARLHSAGPRVSLEEPRHTFTCGQIPAGQTALGRSPCQGGAATHVLRRSNPCRPERTGQVAVSWKCHDTRSQAVKSLPARPHWTGSRVMDEPRHTFICGQIPTGQTALGRLPCQLGGAVTHVHRRSNPCRPDRTRQVSVSGRSRDTRSQAVKYLPARPHWTGSRVMDEPQHTFKDGQIPAGQTVLGRLPCQGGGATHVHKWSNLCRPDRTQQVPVSARRSRDTRSQAVKSLPARPHSAGPRVSLEEPRHTFSDGQIPARQTALGR